MSARLARAEIFEDYSPVNWPSLIDRKTDPALDVRSGQDCQAMSSPGFR
jgi:hypothetical protein